MNCSPEVQLAEKLAVVVARHLREPVVEAAEDAEHRAERQHVVEMRDDVIGILQSGIDARIRQHNAGDAADDEQEDEADRPQHRRLELDRATPHRRDP